MVRVVEKHSAVMKVLCLRWVSLSCDSWTNVGFREK